MKTELELDCETRTNAINRRIILWLVDDSNNFREILAENFAYESEILCSRQFPSAEALLAALENEVPPDVILMDVNMHGMKGVDAVAPIKKLAPRTRVLMLTSFYDSRDALTAFRAGASGFLLKSYNFERIARTVTDAREAWPDSWFKMKPVQEKAVETKAPVREAIYKPIEAGWATHVARLAQFFSGIMRREPPALFSRLANWLF